MGVKTREKEENFFFGSSGGEGNKSFENFMKEYFFDVVEGFVGVVTGVVVGEYFIYLFGGEAMREEETLEKEFVGMFCEGTVIEEFICFCGDSFGYGREGTEDAFFEELEGVDVGCCFYVCFGFFQTEVEVVEGGFVEVLDDGEEEGGDALGEFG